MTHHDEPEGYDGEATVEVDGQELRTAHIVLTARFDPFAGRLVWTGRVSVALPPGTGVAIGTHHDRGEAEAVEPDPWGNTRIRGVGRPPFPSSCWTPSRPPEISRAA